MLIRPSPVILFACLLLSLVVATACRESVAASDQVKRFDKFPVVWAGEEWDSDDDGSPDTPVTLAREFITAPGRFAPETHGFEIVYGDCKIPEGQTEGGCSLPLHIVVYPACETPRLAEDAKIGKATVRGVEADITASAAVWIETQEFTVQITHAAPLKPGDLDNHVDKALAVAAQLHGANDKAEQLTQSNGFTAKSPASCGEAPGSGPGVAETDARLAIDAVIGNGEGPCSPVDSQASSAIGSPVAVGLCIVDGAAAPVNGGFNTVTLTVSYAGPLGATNAASDLQTDLGGNPDWNEAGLGGNVWDCNLLNAQATAPRAAPSPATITCITVSLADQAVSGNVLLATLTLEGSVPGTAVLSWDGDTSILAGPNEVTCADGITCLGATIVIE